MPSARAAVTRASSLISLGLLALGSFVIYETQGIAEAQGYAQVGPRLFPYLDRRRARRSAARCSAGTRSPAAGGTCRSTKAVHATPDWMAFCVISAGIVLHMLIIGWAGFILASILLFVLVARGFGSTAAGARRGHRASCSAVAVFVVFTLRPRARRCPQGPFELGVLHGTSQRAAGGLRGRADAR